MPASVDPLKPIGVIAGYVASLCYADYWRNDYAQRAKPQDVATDRREV